MEAHLLELSGGEPASGVRTDRVEGDVAEVQQARVADDHVQADGHDHEHEDRHRSTHVGEGENDRDVGGKARDVVRIGRREHDHSDDGKRRTQSPGDSVPPREEPIDRFETRDAAETAVHGQAPSGVRSLSSPSGRKTRIAIRSPKTIDRVQSLPGAAHVNPSLNAWISPMMIPPSTAPGRFPIPPRTAAVKAIRPSSKPVSYRMLNSIR